MPYKSIKQQLYVNCKWKNEERKRAKENIDLYKEEVNPEGSRVSFPISLKGEKIIKGARTLTKGEGIRHKIMRFSLKGARELK